ncbi:MAG: serine--tRNA ligase [Streptomycetaceae bacterium]|jgi:seryl-tRNA synthetase|nr:serine--tRNA ligase [Actinomycetota bacterium]TRZ83911.1 MAG: serine--tRNA ligase [Streptomycetaceae bacterium]
MIDLKVLRENPEVMKKSQTVRGENPDLVDAVLAADDARRAALSEYELLRAEQNVISKSVASAKGDEKAALLEKAKSLSASVKNAEAKKNEAEVRAKDTLMGLSNFIDPIAPVGGEADFKVIEEVGTPRDFKKEGFEAKDHVELGKILGAIDVERGAKVSGSRFYYLTGMGAMLEFALVNYAIASASKNGFIPVIPPVLVKPAAMEGTGFLGQAAENVFHLKEDDFYLVGTSEVPLAAYHMDETLDANKLPLRYSGYSSCFRREAGTYGKDTRGIIRVHQFDKVEMFSFCKPEDAKAEHLRILQWEKDFLDAMEIPYRVIDVASGDLGASAARKFDCEAWIPTQGTYREVTSTSNCTEFQARRLNIRMKDNEGTKAIATLNGTLVAIPRMIVAILENHQQPDGSVKIPKALHPFLGTDKFLPVKN